MFVIGASVICRLILFDTQTTEAPVMFVKFTNPILLNMYVLLPNANNLDTFIVFVFCYFVNSGTASG
jgi:tellurite resistance protein TehA-like permease